MTHRRRFLGALSAVLALAPIQLRAQPQGKVYRIGYLSLRAGMAANDEAFVRALRDLGYVVGRDIAVEYRWAGNRMEALQPMAEELVRLDVDLIVAATTPAIDAAMRATTAIPIVMITPSDPIRSKLVASLSRPGGNVTGPSLLVTDLARKRVQLVRELVPGLTRIALLGQQESASLRASGRGPTQNLIAETQTAARQAGIDMVAQVVVTAEDLPKAFAEFQRARAQALIIQGSPFTFEHRAAIRGLVARERLPDMHDGRVFVDDGGLVSYGPDVTENYRRAATYVDKIRRGAKPADLPIEQPTKIDLVINLRTAKALGLTIPQSLLARADEVIR